ncbi:alpha-1,2-fucosyltransferase [Spirosoma agri]|uniref:Alpha-1,2-fucosyltransferase n=1 Tax=Spirosoma agri TaxID=1987381 RepID=A0A6M0INB9_9BACT|nr:alpha-1,2-fucosyltransferase [Spirosoma agri]NEU69594.1 alpha-1,2-fucosyltransferase [Spirosoma agri]
MIIVRLAGGLGNQLFQYAFGRALAHRHNVPLKLDLHVLEGRNYDQTMTARAYALDLFGLPVPFATPAEVAPYVPFVTKPSTFLPAQYGHRLLRKVSRSLNPRYVVEKDAARFDAGVLLTAPSHCYVAGYWQSERYFLPIQQELRSELRVVTPLTGPAIALAEHINTVEAVCVHVRRTDFLTDVHQTTLTPAQIRQGVQVLIRRGVKPVLFVFSDDIDWCRRQVRVNDAPVHYVSEEAVGGNVGVHFQLMMGCRHFINSVSTFSWWAAWLSKHPTQLVFHPPHRRSSDWAAQHWITLTDA